MTAKEIQQRNTKAENLRVLQTDDGQFFVESGEGKILYNVSLDDLGDTCTCGDFAKNVKRDNSFKCKHILAVYNAIPQKQVEGATILEKHIPKLDDRWITRIEGKEFVKYPGLLDLGHQKGIASIEVDIVQMPSKENDNFAVCRATITSRIGESFIDVGDASPANTNSKVSKHLLRMASTRAIARALRSYTNIGMTCLEELSDINDAKNNGEEHDNPKPNSKTAKKTGANPKKKTDTKASDPKTDEKTNPPTDETTTEKDAADKNPTKTNSSAGMSEAQKRAIYNLSRRRGISVKQLEQMAADAYGSEIENLTSSDASAFIRQLQQAA